MKIQKLLGLLFIFTIGVLIFAGPVKRSFAVGDTSPPKISEVNIFDVSTSSAIIQWTTDEKSDSMVNYGLNKNYGVARDALFSKTHQIVIQNLTSGATHYFQIVSSDISGNQSISRGYQFLTERISKQDIEGIETIPTTREQAIVENAVEALGKITMPESLVLLLDKLEELAARLTEAPRIIGEPKLEIGMDYVIIRWVTDKESNSMVALATEEDYNPVLEDPYIWKEGDPDELVLSHEINVGGLTPATVYHFQISSEPELGLASKSDDRAFKTKSPLPEIYNIRVLKVEENSATLAWTTNAPCSTIVEYTDIKTQEIRSAGDPNLIKDHTFQLVDLKLGASYSSIIKAKNEYEQEGKSNPIIFTTAKDEFPPIISKINVESALYPGVENKIQTIIDWETDEPSLCQVFYQEGLVLKAETSSFLKSNNFIERHVQVSTIFAPATVYKFWIECEDGAGNQTRSEDFTLLTPQQEKSILDIIIENFEQTFGWVKDIKI